MSDKMLQEIETEIKENKVVLFMKGTPEFPRCGYSSRAVETLRTLGFPFVGVDVLVDPDYRFELSAYSDWPTIPQLFIEGNLIGGSDIMLEMFESGELRQILEAIHQPEESEAA